MASTGLEKQPRNFNVYLSFSQDPYVLTKQQQQHKNVYVILRGIIMLLEEKKLIIFFIDY